MSISSRNVSVSVYYLFFRRFISPVATIVYKLLFGLHMPCERYTLSIIPCYLLYMTLSTLRIRTDNLRQHTKASEHLVKWLSALWSLSLGTHKWIFSCLPDISRNTISLRLIYEINCLCKRGYEFSETLTIDPGIRITLTRHNRWQEVMQTHLYYEYS